MNERDKILEKANRHYTKKEFARAIEVYGKYLQAYPGDAQATARLGDCYALSGSKDRAIRYYARAAELYAMGGWPMKAIGLHKRVLALDPSMADPNTYLSYLELSRLEAEKAAGEKTGLPLLREESELRRTPDRGPRTQKKETPAAFKDKQVSLPPSGFPPSAPDASAPLPVETPSSPPTEAPQESVFILGSTSQTFVFQEPADKPPEKEKPLELLSPLDHIPLEEPSPEAKIPAAEPPGEIIEVVSSPPEVKKPASAEAASIQAQQEALIKKIEDSGLGLPPVVSPQAEPAPPPPMPPPPEEKIPSFDWEPVEEELEAPAAPLDLSGDELEFEIKVIPETAELLRQKPEEVTREKEPAPPALVPEIKPPAAPPPLPSLLELPSDYELSLPESPPESLVSRPPGIEAPPPGVEDLPHPLKPPVMDLSTTPIKKSQPSFKIPLLRELTPPEFVRVCETLKVHHLKANTLLFRQGDPGDSLFFINSGKVKIYLGAGGEEETLAYLGEGELFGEFAFLTGAPRQANVKADRETELLELSREDLEPILESHPRVREALIHFYKERALNNVLNQTVIFRPLGKIEKALVASNLEYKRFKPGEIIIQEGTMGDELYFLVTGKVRVTTYEGLVFLADLYPPELFGEISLVTNQPRTATVTATTPVEVLYLRKEQLLELMQRYPKVQGPLKQLYEARLQDIADKIAAAKKASQEGGAPFLT